MGQNGTPGGEAVAMSETHEPAQAPEQAEAQAHNQSQDQDQQQNEGPAQVALDAPITEVTVFTDGARVTRVGQTELRPGLTSVVVAALPDSADPASVRVAARGHDLALVNVEVQRRVGTVPLRARLAELRADVARWRDAVRELEDEDAGEQASLGFLGQLSEAAATALARSMGAGRVGYDELSGMAGHLTASTRNVLAKKRDVARRKLQAQRELEAAVERLSAAETHKGHPVVSIEVMALIEATQAAPADVEVTYHVAGASWQPLYDLLLNGELLTVSYLAEITQQTGENWPEVALVLSTTRQGLRQTLPELSPWYIGRPQPPRVMARATARRAPVPGGPMQAMTAAGYAQLSAGDTPTGEQPAVPSFSARPEARVLAAVPGGSESEAGLTYTVARPLAVPGDGGPHKTLIARFGAEAVLDYLTVPVLAPEAYLRATVTNGQLLLLPGQARIFHGQQFVGETRLEVVAPGEEFEVQLGVDDQIKVERKLKRRTTSKAMLGGNRTIDIGYEITVENHRNRRVTVSLHDHIPVSTDGDIKVKSRETTPPPASTDDLGELTWNIALTPGESATVTHRFTVEHPAQAIVAGL
jgi:uncharacterized protein (TIGR02231 family)